MRAKALYVIARLGACGAVVSMVAMSAVPAIAASGFAGNWVGPWRETTLRQSGSFLLVIGKTGTIEGIVTNGATHGLVHGEIADSGDLNAVYSYDGKTFYAARGTFVRQGSHLLGTAHYFTSANQPIGSSALDLRLSTETSVPDIVKIAQPAAEPISGSPRAL